MKKFVLTLVCAAVVLPVLAGCWSKKEDVAPEVTPVQVAEEVTTPAEEAAESSKEEYVA